VRPAAPSAVSWGPCDVDASPMCLWLLNEPDVCPVPSPSPSPSLSLWAPLSLFLPPSRPLERATVTRTTPLARQPNIYPAEEASPNSSRTMRSRGVLQTSAFAVSRSSPLPHLFLFLLLLLLSFSASSPSLPVILSSCFSVFSRSSLPTLTLHSTLLQGHFGRPPSRVQGAWQTRVPDHGG